MKRSRSTRVLATVLFADMVDSTRIAAELGDRRWRGLRRAYHGVLRSLIRQFGGREVDMAGDGVLATFSDQDHAIRCACAIARAVRKFGAEVRCGVHVGQADRAGRSLGGIAVHTGARIMSVAGPGEVVVSSVLRDLVSGSDFTFADLGSHPLKGVPEEVRLYKVVAVDGATLDPPLSADEARRRRSALEPPALLHPGTRRRWLAAVVGGLIVTLGVVAILASGGAASRPIRIVPQSLLRLDPKTGKVIADIRIVPPGGTEFSAVPPDEVWVLSHQSQVISIISAKTNTRQDTIGGFGVAQGGTGFALRYGAASVWIATEDPSIARMNPDSHQVSQIPLPIGANLLAYDNDHNRLWAITYDHPDGLYALDPTHNQASLLTKTQGGVNAIVAGEGAVWLANYPSNTVSKVDPTTGSSTIIRLAPQRAFNPSGMGIGFGYIWVSSSGVPGVGQTLSRIDPTTNKVRTVAICGYTSSVVTDVATADDGVWVTCPSSRQIVRINPTTLHIRRIKLVTTGQPTAMISAYGSLWATIEPGS